MTLLEVEYQRAVAAAELAWVNGVLDDLRAGALAWSEQGLVEAAKTFLPG